LKFHALIGFAQTKHPGPASDKTGLFHGKLGITLQERGLLNTLNREIGRLFCGYSNLQTLRYPAKNGILAAFSHACVRVRSF
jgi:hypothetical protein